MYINCFTRFYIGLRFHCNTLYTLYTLYTLLHLNILWSMTSTSSTVTSYNQENLFEVFVRKKNTSTLVCNT